MGSEQMRKVQLTINNPEECGLNRETIKKLLMRFHPSYFCLADEIASTGTPHTHIFMYSQSAFRFSTIKNRFPCAHVERAYASAKDNRDYIRKEGKWVDDRKAETSVPGSFEEFGNIPDERAEKNPDMFVLIEDILAGKTTAQIISDKPKFAFRAKDIDILRQTLLADKYAAENRKVDVTYIYGSTGSGKTRGIYERHNARDICRITNYGNVGRGITFDSYCGQDVMVFEEFHSQINVGDMLNYLDIYPLMLPARYSDKVACYTTVYITSNLPLDEQYANIQTETWKAFMRRINHVIEYCKNGNIIIHK